MFSHPIRIATLVSAAGPAVRSAWASLLTVGASLVLIALGTGIASPLVEGAPAAAVVSTRATSSAPAASPATGCWVTGDLVGEDNPAAVATALCG